MSYNMEGTFDEHRLNSYTVSSFVKGPTVLITAGVHGDEYEPMLVAHKLVFGLKGLLKKGTVTIVPMVNHSAYQNLSRFGIDGLDVARICPGNPNGSTSESCAHLVSELIEKADYYIDMHTGGKVYDIFPLAGYLLHADDNVLSKQRDMAKAFALPAIWGTNQETEGRTLSVARDANVPAIYVEYGGGVSASQEIINAYYKGCLNVLQHLEMLDGAVQDPVAVDWWLEDYTLNNGNLQIKMPSPIAGVFVPEVKLGDFISAGSVWGTVTNPINYLKTKIIARDSGLVFVLRTKAYVDVGDSLGGTLRADKNKITVINGN